MIKSSPKWLKISAIAISFPSTVLLVGWGAFELAEMGFFSKEVAIIILLLVIIQTLFLMVYYAYKKKD